MKKKAFDESKNLEDFINNTKKDLENKIEKMITNKDIKSIIKGGKRLRSLLANLTFKTCTKGKISKTQYEKALEGEVVIELAHAASLVHDDIIDNDKHRRGKQSYFVVNGTANAILTGHKMLVMGFNIALNHGEEWAKLYVDSWDDVINGELSEVEINKNGFNKEEISSKSKIFEIYNKIIDFKTAALFASACQAGALEANMKGDILKIFSNYGREIGLAYQLADDLVDLENGEMIESVIVPLLNKINGNSKSVNLMRKRDIKRKYKKNEEKIRELYLDEIKKHIKRAEKLAQEKIIPDSSYKKLLKDFPSFIINEMLKSIDIEL